MSDSRRTVAFPQLLGLIAVLLLGSCRSVPLAPVAPQIVTAFDGSHGGEWPGHHHDGADVPAIRDLRAFLHGDTLYIRAQFRPAPARSRAPYDPARPGGWALQLFMNTDQAPSGYWLGIDYLVRGTEVLPEKQFVVRRVTLEPEFPGGWGPQSGSARYAVHSQDVVLAIPLSAVGGDDGAMDFVLETYSTVACPECPDGISQIFIADYFGTIRPRRFDLLAGLGEPIIELTMRSGAQRLGALALARARNPLLNPTSAW